jgi:hypothetical protein
MQDSWTSKTKRKKTGPTVRWQFNKDILHYQCFGPNYMANVTHTQGPDPVPIEYYRLVFMPWNDDSRSLPMLGDNILKHTPLNGKYPKMLMDQQHVPALGNI